MSALIGTPPLRKVSSFLEAASPEVVVPVRLKEPLWRTGARVELLVACMQAQMLLERAYHGSGITCTVDEVYAAHPRVHALLVRICEAAATLQADPSPLQLLEDTGLAAMAPYVAQLLSGGAFGAHAREHVPASHEYHEHASAIDQLLTISQQLSRDVSAGVHKYTAHKLALLYHAVNLSKFRREELRRREAFPLPPSPSSLSSPGGGRRTKRPHPHFNVSVTRSGGGRLLSDVSWQRVRRVRHIDRTIRHAASPPRDHAWPARCAGERPRLAQQAAALRGGRQRAPRLLRSPRLMKGYATKHRRRRERQCEHHLH